MTDAVRRVVADCVGDGVEVVDARRLTGGASAETWAVDARAADGTEHAWVLRLVRPGTAGMSIGPVAEVAVQRAAAAAGVPVPTIVGGSEEGYVMERLSGETVPRRILRDDEYAAARPRLLGQVASALAAVHATPVDADAPPTSRWATQLEQLRTLHDAVGAAVPTFEVAFAWLRSVQLPAASPVLVHGDFRTGNLMVDADGLVAVLDWELAHPGDRWEDLGWFCSPAWRFGGPEAGGLGERADLYAAYAEASGVAVDAAAVHAWEVLATLKWGVICEFQASRHLGGDRSVELAAIGRRVTETELDLLLLLDEVA